MKRESPVWIIAGLVALAVGSLVGFGASGAIVILIAALGILFVTYLGNTMANSDDRAWLARWVAIGFAAKLFGTVARFVMVSEIYGIGDSFRYYRVGTELAGQWRSGHVPQLTGTGSLGTQVVEAFTGGLFAIITPDMLGGFLLFAIVGFLGQLFFYAAFRRHAAPHQLKPYAVLIFLLPTYAFWPSSIGKDALVLLTLGAAAYFAARSLKAFEVRWLLALGVALVALGLVRIHIAGLVVAAFIAATLVAKVPIQNDLSVVLRRFLTLGAGVAAALIVVGLFPDLFGVDLLSTQDRDGFTADIFRRTSTGTVGSGGFVSTPWDLPAALAHVLFRPFLFEATELQHILAAGETLIIAAFALWRLPAILRNLKKWRSNAYVVFCTFYTIGFAVAFSVVRNLGIIARQRGQVLAFFLCFVIALGWEAKPKKKPRALSPPLEPVHRL